LIVSKLDRLEIIFVSGGGFDCSSAKVHVASRRRDRNAKPANQVDPREQHGDDAGCLLSRCEEDEFA